MNLGKILGTMLLSILLSLIVFQIAQPLFFEAIRGSEPEDWLTLGILALGIGIATGATALVYVLLYSKESKKIRKIVLFGLRATLVIFMLISYFQFFTSGLFTYPWWQILSMAIVNPSVFWVIWCCVYSMICGMLAIFFKIETEAIAY